MYGKVFASLWSGSMYAKTDAQLVFIYMLCNCDRHGVLDVTQEAIAGPVGMSVDRVRAAIEYLESADARSRTDGNEGRRILRVDEHRDWGWQIVNYKHYRELRDEDQRREAARVRMANRRERMRTDANTSEQFANVRHGSPQFAHAEAEAEGKATPSLPVATLREGAPFGRAISIEISRTQNLKESFPGTTADYAGAGNDATQGPPASASGGWGAAAGPCDASAARIGTPDAQEGTEDRAGSRIGPVADSEGAETETRDPGESLEARDYINPVREIARPHGGAVVSKTLALCGRLYNSGRRDTGFLQHVAAHFVVNRHTIQEPFAYYLGETAGSQGLRLDLAASSTMAEHQRHTQEIASLLGESRTP